jgi:indole-3-glycerol phosphate synthase
MTLDDILDAARQESEERQRKYPLAMLKREVEKKGPTRGFARALQRRRFGVIAELKSRSPSMGSVGQGGDLSLEAACNTYHTHPVVAAISVLTQREFFGGTMEHLLKVRQNTQCRPKPILRKDFIWTEYEVYFSRWIGADAILLMANVVKERDRFKHLHDLAISLGLDVLCEVHTAQEIELIPDTALVCGINSRRFKDVDQKKSFRVTLREKLGGKVNRDTQTDLSTFELFDRLPADCVRVAESGISSDNIGGILGKHPFQAALIGTALLKAGSDMKIHLDRIQADAERVLAPESVVAGEIAFAR